MKQAARVPGQGCFKKAPLRQTGGASPATPRGPRPAGRQAPRGSQKALGTAVRRRGPSAVQDTPRCGFLKALPATGARRPFGLAKGRLDLPDDLSAPDAEVEALFTGTDQP